jgi:hypothetical protein
MFHVKQKGPEMEIVVKINTCQDCRHLDHSGAFTVGGERPVCRHHGACYGSHAKIAAGETAVDVMMKTGMARPVAEKYVARAERDDKTEKIFEKEIPMLLLQGFKPGDCYHWAHRVPFTDWKNPTIPDWCPLKNGAAY